MGLERHATSQSPPSRNRTGIVLGVAIAPAAPILAEWFFWVVFGMPSLLVDWFLSPAYLGGLAGEPF